MRGADYVATEIRRAVQAIGGKAPLIAGIGIDIPHDNRPLAANPDEVTEVVRRAFAAGAAGILISREYDEMRVANLRAIGRALN
jgi:dihydrodipicolinate synthase/N-acetylneuraminate lyase